MRAPPVKSRFSKYKILRLVLCEWWLISPSHHNHPSISFFAEGGDCVSVFVKLPMKSSGILDTVAGYDFLLLLRILLASCGALLSHQFQFNTMCFVGFKDFSTAAMLFDLLGRYKDSVFYISRRTIRTGCGVCSRS